MSLNSAAEEARVGASQGTVRVYALDYAALANFEMR